MNQTRHLLLRQHRILRMKQEPTMDMVIRERIRGLRRARGWSLDALAARCFLSPSTLSRIETGHRRIALDQLVPLARALGTTLDELVEPLDDDDVVIRPEPSHEAGWTVWVLSHERTLNGATAAKIRIPADSAKPQDELRVHPGREWFTVLSGTARVQLGERTILVETGHGAEFSTMVPHAIGAHDGPVELISIFDAEGERVHLRDSDAA